MSATAIYLLNDGDDWFVHVDGYYSDFALHADGQPAEQVTDASSSQRWWRIDHRPERLEMVGGPTKKVVAYELPAGVTLSDHPSSLPPDEWRARFIDGDGDYTDDVARLYEAVTEECEPTRTPLDVPTVVLDGTPPPDDGLTWVARLPFALRERREYLHLFPGHFANDFREALVARLERMACVEHVFKHKPGPLEVSVRVHYEPVVWWPKRNSRGRVTKVNGTQGYVTHRLELRAPTQIAGANRAEALERWHAEMGEFVAAAEEAAAVVPCGHCDGRGWNSEAPR